MRKHLVVYNLKLRIKIYGSLYFTTINDNKIVLSDKINQFYLFFKKTIWDIFLQSLEQ